MYINLKLFMKAEYLAFFRSPFGFRRWVYTIALTGLFSMMWLLLAFGRALDHVLSPDFRRQPVRAPVFIIAPPRSGTTLAQKLMAADAHRFIHHKLYQTIFPCIAFQRLLHAMVKWDQRTGRRLARAGARFEKQWFGSWDDLHRIRLDQPEEEGGLFVYSFVNASIYLLFPFVSQLWNAGFPDELPARSRSRLMKYYRSCLQRHAWLHGQDKTVLCKATQNCGAVESLLEEFPDAKFVTIIRHPYEAVASHVSIFWPVWKHLFPNLQPDSAVTRDYAFLAIRWYQHLLRFKDRVPHCQYYCISYKELTADPRKAIEGLYRHFGWTLEEEFAARLNDAETRQHSFRSKHCYSLEQFGLSRGWIQGHLERIFDYYALER